jgi:hypothetical protein
VCLHAGKLIAFDTSHKPAQRKTQAKKCGKKRHLSFNTKKISLKILEIAAVGPSYTECNPTKVLPGQSPFFSLQVAFK